MKIFICSNNNQLIGAKVAKNSILRRSKFLENDIKILLESEVQGFEKFFTQPYLRRGRMVNFDKNDMQSFTLLRFHIPFLMSFEGSALVIDPDIFQVNDGIESLLDLDNENVAIHARKGIFQNSWGSSAMLLSCSHLRHWILEELIEKLHQGEIDYDNLINLRIEQKPIQELETKWNEFDEIKENTILLHTTEKITQPWRAGLKLNSSIPPILRFIPRAPIYKLLGKDLTVGREHPNKEVTDFFFNELAVCLSENIISNNELNLAISKNFIRPDIHEKLKTYKV